MLKSVAVTDIKPVTDKVFLLKVRWENPVVKAGQFFMINVEGKLLPRPISICDIENDTLVFCIDTVGEGTKRLSRMKVGDTLTINGPLGNGFDVEALNKCKKVALVSGSVGIAPMVYLSKQLNCEVHSFCGFADEPYFAELLKNPRIATDSGRYGRKGLVTELFNVADYDMVAACGSENMLKAVGKLCVAADVPCQISLDAHMACGVGACLTCACETLHGYKRCCADGPVFWAEVLYER